MSTIQYTRESLSQFKRIVIKVGTCVVTHSDGNVALARIAQLIEQVSELVHQGKEIILVSSGSIGFGRRRLLQQALLSTPLRSHLNPNTEFRVFYDKKLSQAAAAAGQIGLMSVYELLFAQRNVSCSQVLLTDADFKSQKTRNSLKQTIDQLLSLSIIPVLNENDVISQRETPLTDEKGAIFWDNDSLAALVAKETKADLLVLLTDVKGLYKTPPTPENKSEIIHTYVPNVEVTIGERSRLGRGGMQAKIDAAMDAVRNGVKAVVIASGYEQNSILRIINGEKLGTLFIENPPREEESARYMATEARRISRELQKLSSDERKYILKYISEKLIENENLILQANVKDLDIAKKQGINQSLYKRLSLNKEKLKVLAKGIQQIAQAPDPINRVLRKTEVSEGLILEQVTTPIGVLLVIFESRPDVLPQVAALAIKSGNGLLLKGGKEAFYSNKILHQIIVDSIHEATNGKIQKGIIGLVETREEIADLLQLDKEIDLVIPRGSSQLVTTIQQKTKIPVLGHAEGICHIYVDINADFEKAEKIILDAKTDYPAACNAVETLLFHKDIPQSTITKILKSLKRNHVLIYAGPRACHVITLLDGRAKSYRKEYSDLAITVELVDNIQEAISHINAYGSGHTDCIITEDDSVAKQFLEQVDSACVFHNVSTRFADGYRFGLGAEVGIATGRIHARGPVGIEGLLTTKWKLVSKKGHIVKDFTLGKEKYTHKMLRIRSKL